MPDPGPLPLRMRARCEPTGGFRSCSARRGNSVSEPGAWGFALDLGFREVFAFALGMLLLSFCLWFLTFRSVRRAHLNQVTHLLQHAPQRGMIGVHDFSLVMLETQGLERPLHAVGMAVPRASLLDAQLALRYRRQDPIPPRFAFTILPRGRQPTHGSPPAALPTPDGRDTESHPARRHARARPVAPSSGASSRPSSHAPCCAGSSTPDSS